jgi:hypothetical protein
MYENGPVDLRPLHPILWYKLTSNGRLRRLVEQLLQISNMATPLGTSGGAMVGPGGVACGPLTLLARPLAPFVHFCHHFALFLLYFPAYK